MQSILVVDALQYTSTYALTETGACPISATAETETAYHTLVPGSALGHILNTTFCNPAMRRGVLDHPVHASRDGLTPLGFVQSTDAAS